MGFGYFIGIPIISKQPIATENFILSSIVSILYIGVLLFRFARQDKILRERNHLLEMQTHKVPEPSTKHTPPAFRDRPDTQNDPY